MKMKARLRYIIIFLLSTVASITYAQVEFNNRIEFALDNGYSQENIVELGSNGFIMYALYAVPSNRQRVWNYQLYDTLLRKVNATNILIPNKFVLDDYWHNDDTLVTLFKNRKGFYVISSLDINTLRETRVSGRFPKRSIVSNMTVFGDYAYFSMNIKRNKFLYSINWKTGEQKTIPIQISGYTNREIKVEQFQYLKESDEVFLYISANKRRQVETYVMMLDDNGNKTKLFKLTGDIDKNFINISAQCIGNNKYLYAGTYSNKGSVYSDGIFFCKLVNDKIDFIKYYKYSDLSNFFKYLPKRKQKKIAKKKKKKKAKGKSLKVKYMIALHKIIKEKDGYILIGEAYFPTYRTVTTTSYVNGSPQTTTYTVFDGYKYTHAVIIKFSKTGELMWDQVFKMMPYSKPFYVKRFISVDESAKNGEIHIAFSDDDKIVSKAFDSNGKVIYDKETNTIKTDYQGDHSKWTISNLDYWYDNYFISYGTQKIKNTSSKKTKHKKNVKRKRKVFFISKIEYE